jgi:hypothetical protein
MLFLEAISSAIRSIEMLSTCFDHSSGSGYHQRVRCTALMLVPIMPALVIWTNPYEEYAGLKLTPHNFSTIAQLFQHSDHLRCLILSLPPCCIVFFRCLVFLSYPSSLLSSSLSSFFRSRLPLVSPSLALIILPHPCSLALVLPWSKIFKALDRPLVLESH